MAALTSCLWAQSLEKKPGLDLGFEERIRSEEWNNLIDHDNQKADPRTQFRFRSRLWASAAFSSGLQIVAGLCGENRKTTRPDSLAYNGREVFFDTLYVDYGFAPGWSVRAGRQNLMRGEGFILMDGSPGDGSRSLYFNALVLTHAWGNATLEFMAIADPQSDEYLPVINKIGNPKELVRLNEWDERAVGAYYTGRGWARTSLEAYGFLKTERHDYRPASNAQFQPDRRIATLGSRVVREAGQGWTLTGEFALQQGTQEAGPGTAGGPQDIQAWGGYARARKTFEGAGNPAASLGYIALSGDDPATGKVEGWDPLFSRWPKWSELYIYAQIPERGVAYWTNTGMWEVEGRLSPAKGLDLRATWYRMAAFQAPAAPGATFGTGRLRGDLWQIRADLRVNDHLKGHVLYEHLAPGSFYATRDPGYFLRVEAICTFKTRH